jgi:sec-independent protein translocase protein TatA
MPSLGFPEMFIVFLIVIVLFGASRLPQIGKGLGEGIKNFKKGLKGDETPDQLEEKTPPRS